MSLQSFKIYIKYNLTTLLVDAGQICQSQFWKTVGFKHWAIIQLKRRARKWTATQDSEVINASLWHADIKTKLIDIKDRTFRTNQICITKVAESEHMLESIYESVSFSSPRTKLVISRTGSLIIYWCWIANTLQLVSQHRSTLKQSQQN